jgi:hypothetical protein
MSPPTPSTPNLGGRDTDLPGLIAVAVLFVLGTVIGERDAVRERRR